jgi:hypothetical protein
MKTYTTAKSSKDPLFELIKSLTKSEKRNFKLYVKRINNPEETKFILLFDALDKMNEYDESRILDKIKSIRKVQLSNLKSHLYKQLLLSLRLNNINNDIDIQIREQLDYAKVLYNKGLYRQSLKVLDRIKSKAKEYKRDILHMEILHYEKSTELQYITGSFTPKAESLCRESDHVKKMLNTVNDFSNLALKLYGLYLKIGYIRNEKDYYMVKEFFHSNLPKYDIEELHFNEKLYLYRAYIWYNYIIQDFQMCYEYSKKWVELFQKHNLQFVRAAAYLKGLNSLLAALYKLGKHPEFIEALKLLDEFATAPSLKLDGNLSLLLFQFQTIHHLNRHFTEGTFREGTELVPGIELQIQELGNRIDEHNLKIIYYKLACLYLGAEEIDKAISYLTRILQSKSKEIREDIQCFTRILLLICHYEQGEENYMEYQIKSTYRFIGKMKDIHQFQKEIFQFLRKLTRIYPDQLKNEFILLKEKLEILKTDPYENRPFLYFDIISWLESRIENKPVHQVIGEKFRSRYGI